MDKDKKTLVCEGIITSDFGIRVNPVTGVESFHKGIDIACKVGTVVRSPARARVESVYRYHIEGLTIVLRDLENNHCYLYAHLHKSFVNESDIVCDNDIIALAGNSGESIEPHLHFAHATGNGIIDEFVYQDPKQIAGFK